MKLKTKMTTPDSTCATYYPVERESEDGRDYIHDAAAAHALLRAINFIDACPPHDPVEAKAQRVAMDAIWRMANARMREWGFAEDGQ